MRSVCWDALPPCDRKSQEAFDINTIMLCVLFCGVFFLTEMLGKTSLFMLQYSYTSQAIEFTGH